MNITFKAEKLNKNSDGSYEAQLSPAQVKDIAQQIYREAIINVYYTTILNRQELFIYKNVEDDDRKRLIEKIVYNMVQYMTPEIAKDCLCKTEFNDFRKLKLTLKLPILQINGDKLANLNLNEFI